VALGELLRALERDAADEARAVVDAARSAAAELEAVATRSRGDVIARAAREHGDAIRRAADATVAEAQRAARSRVLAARAAMLDRVRAEIAALLPARADALRARLARAAASYGEGIRHDEPTGVVIELPSGARNVATLEALVDRDWAALAATIVREAVR